MRNILIISLFIFNLSANECDKEQLFWSEIKSSKDIEDFKYYNKKYPDGIYNYLANKYIKQLGGASDTITMLDDEPLWIDGKTLLYKYYGVGKANKHFKGIKYQVNLAQKRAKRELLKKFDEDNITTNRVEELESILRLEKYIDENNKVYILVYIDNYEL
ncbi:MAG: hypothetical protein U9R16_08250 [Campylobacterota bacterium]|nr:hypothetical protein [Campylobacterota bacterium]